VTTAGFEPARPYEHQPLKLASLPFLHVAQNKKWRDYALQCFSNFCDPTGARTQDPIIKSDVLYQLSYRVIDSRKVCENHKICDPTGARTQDPIIKSDVLYQLSYRVIFFS
jgi:hypothetical protein